MDENKKYEAELSDEELDQAAGGASTPMTAQRASVIYSGKAQKAGLTDKLASANLAQNMSSTLGVTKAESAMSQNQTMSAGSILDANEKMNNSSDI
ncbi:MAG: hypothetical protein IKN38_00125 [Clostridia bacterium]|nr:hypothetical protein [Clostridia bacterium]